MQSPYAPPKAALDTPPAYTRGNWKSPRGRIGRLRYWVFNLALLLVFAPLLATRELVNFATHWAYSGVLAALLGLIYVAGAFLINAKRIHDIGGSAWWLLLYLVPGLNNLLPLFLLLMPGSHGPNAYGLPAPPNSLPVKLGAALFTLAIAALLLAVASGWWLLHSLQL